MYVPTIPYASNDELGGREDKSGAASRGMVEMEASPYLIRTGAEEAERFDCCRSLLLLRALSGWRTSPPPAAQMMILRARPGMVSVSKVYTMRWIRITGCEEAGRSMMTRLWEAREEECGLLWEVLEDSK